jgi:hypothetical protein
MGHCAHGPAPCPAPAGAPPLVPRMLCNRVLRRCSSAADAAQTTQTVLRSLVQQEAAQLWPHPVGLSSPAACRGSGL